MTTHSSLASNLLFAALLAALALLTVTTQPVTAQMVMGDQMPGWADALGVDGKPSADFSVRETGVVVGATHGANVLWPGETATFALHVTNNTAAALAGPALIHVVGYGTTTTAEDVWVPHVFRISSDKDTPVALNVPAKGGQDISVTPNIPERFGGYALVLDIPGHGKTFAATLVRCLPADPGAVQNPTYALDLRSRDDDAMTVLQRLGIKGVRMEFGYTRTTDANYANKLKEYADFFTRAKKYDIAIMLTVEGNIDGPLAQMRSYLNEKGEGKFTYPGDMAWSPVDDPDFRVWSHDIAAQFGWPKGPVNAMELWNEPWDGSSISGWGADILRYREMYEQMALGVRDARAKDGTWVLTGGACSSMNTRDKLFPDGEQKFLPWLDFVSMHYQPLGADPAIEPDWQTRPAAMGGPIQVWDTESWFANSEDRIGGVIASMRSLGQSRTAGIFHGNVYDTDGPAVQVYSPGAALAATQKFIGQRPFKQLAIKGGLPWVYEFGGRPLTGDDKTPGSIEDGTLVIVGDLGGLYQRSKTLYRTVCGLKNRAAADAAAAKLAATSPGAPDYNKVTAAYGTASALEGASMTIAAQRGFLLYDFYGNPVPSAHGKFIIPLNDHGYFLRTTGSAGSFDKLRAAVLAGRIDGLEPVEIVVHDMTARLAAHPAIRIDLTNVLNRPVTGTLHVAVGGLTLDATDKTVTLPPHTVQVVAMTVTAGTEADDNQYPLTATFNAGKDGSVPHSEKIRVNVIERRTIAVDGDLSDWKGIVPQPVTGSGIGATITQQAWLPMESFKSGIGSGVASGYLAYDDANFYFAAKIADNTPFDGLPRFETRDDDSYFYPATSYDASKNNKVMTWPEGVRRFSYRKDPDIPAGDFPARDNVLIAFNVVPEAQKTFWSMPPGTEPHYQVYQDTDYEYALNPVAAQYGGGTEIWRLYAPGMPRKHFYPHQPKSPLDGPVKNGKLMIRRDADTRMVECALPWSEIPLVKQALDAGRTIKFSFRINDNGGPSFELAANRSVSKVNNLTFHNDWDEHWANELEFGFAK